MIHLPPLAAPATGTTLVTDTQIRRVFEEVRDIPFGFAAHQDAETLLSCGFGTCAPKHTLLAQRYAALGLRTRYVYVTFLFDDMPGEFPPPLAAAIHDGKPHIHVGLQLERNGRWVDVDATFDAPLARAGFVVTQNWDPRGGTPMTVVPLERVESEVPPAEYAPLQIANRQAGLPGRVVRDVNAWFDTLRRR